MNKSTRMFRQYKLDWLWNLLWIELYKNRVKFSLKVNQSEMHRSQPYQTVLNKFRFILQNSMRFISSFLWSCKTTATSQLYNICKLRNSFIYATKTRWFWIVTGSWQSILRSPHYCTPPGTRAPSCEKRKKQNRCWYRLSFRAQRQVYA